MPAENKTWKNFMPYGTRKHIPEYLQLKSFEELTALKTICEIRRDQTMRPTSERRSLKEKVWQIDDLLRAHNAYLAS